MILYLNGIRLKLGDENRIAQTKQVNDWFSIDNRKTNITNSFKIPRVSENVRAFKNLGIPGNNSDLPYTINRVSLFSDDGECFVYNGRVNIIDSTPDYYSIQILDGNVDLYKDMANDKMNVLDLSSISHDRTIENIIGSWSESEIQNYKYIVADFNGKTLTDEGYLNADALVPSVRVSWLWDKLFEYYGHTYLGNVFDEDRFKKLWMTYPKGMEFPDNTGITIFDSSNFRYVGSLPSQPGWFMRFDTWTTLDPAYLADTESNMRWKVSQSGKYKLKVSGNFNILGSATSLGLSIGKNLTGVPSAFTDPTPYPVYRTFGAEFAPNTEFSQEIVIDLVAGEYVHLMLKGNNNFTVIPEDDPFRFVIEKLSDAVIDFDIALQDFGVKDFFNEITNRFGLIPIRQKYSNEYRFITLSELLSDVNSYDWSGKFVSSEKESYLYSGFDKRNYFRYKYDQKEQEHNDGYLEVNNDNLGDKKTVYQSQLYSPEPNRRDLFGRDTTIYKLYSRDVSQDGDVEYKALDKRFFFISYEIFDYIGVIKSEFYINQAGFINFPAELFNGIDFGTVVSENYPEMGVLLNKSAVQNIKVKLNDSDVSNIDFSKKIFIKQLAGYFLLSKISNYLGRDKETPVELIRINESTTVDDVITSIVWSRVNDSTIRVTITYRQEFFSEALVSVNFLEYRIDPDIPNTGTIVRTMSTTRNNVPVRIQLFSDSQDSEIRISTPHV